MDRKKSFLSDLRVLSPRMAEAEEQERRRLARDLHDVVGQTLTAVGLNISLLEDLIEDHGDKQASERINTAKKLIEQAAKKVRDVMDDLRPSVLDDYGIVTTLKWYGTRFASRTGINVAVEAQTESLRFSPGVERAMFRILQEALSNVEHHSQADSVIICFDIDEERQDANLSIIDNGEGFDLEGLLSGGSQNCLGLTNMAGRALSVGLKFDISSTPGEGTKVQVGTE